MNTQPSQNHNLWSNIVYAEQQLRNQPKVERQHDSNNPRPIRQVKNRRAFRLFKRQVSAQ